MAVQPVKVHGIPISVMYHGEECTLDSIQWIEAAEIMEYLRNYDKRVAAQTTDKTPIWEIIEAVQAASKEGGE